jgi:hypothetical protein
MKGHEKIYLALYWTGVGVIIRYFWTDEALLELRYMLSFFVLILAIALWEGIVSTLERYHLALLPLFRKAVKGINNLLDKMFD